jgi:hypothetical protein
MRKTDTPTAPTAPTGAGCTLTDTAARGDAAKAEQFAVACWAGKTPTELVDLARSLGLPLDLAEAVRRDVGTARELVTKAAELPATRKAAADARAAVESLKKERAAFFAVYEPRAQEADSAQAAATRAEIQADRATGELIALASSKPWLIPDDHLPELIRLRLAENALQGALGPVAAAAQAAADEVVKRERELAEHDQTVSRQIPVGAGPWALSGDPKREPANVARRGTLAAAVEKAKAKAEAAQAAMDAARQPLADLAARLAGL